MYRFILKITILSLAALYNNVSLSMEVFDIQKFSQDVRRHIFVVACPSIQNQLKNCSTSWNAIGAKKAPNMYQLLNDASFRPSYDDCRYIMMHAALDKNVEVMSKVLDCTDQRNFDYDFGSDYLADRYNKKKRFRLCDVYDFKVLLNSTIVVSEKFKELDLGSYPNEAKPFFETSLFRACFAGDINAVKQAVKQMGDEKRYQSKVYDCIVISLYNNNSHCIELLSPLIKHIVMDDTHVDLLKMVMRNNKKHAFKALVKYNVYGRLNEPLLMHAGRKTTILDEFLEQTDIPDIAKYIELCKELGCKTWQEVKSEEEDKENSLFSIYAFIGAFCSVQ